MGIEVYLGPGLRGSILSGRHRTTAGSVVIGGDSPCGGGELRRYNLHKPAPYDLLLPVRLLFLD